MKLLITTVLSLALAGLVNAQTGITNIGKKTHTEITKSLNPVAAPATPSEVLTLAETAFDFGKIPQDKPVTHVFKFTNTGNTPLALDNVQASCGCTTPVWNKDTVAVGQTAEITVGYNAANEGPFSKQVIITYGGSQTKQIVIKGEVWKTPLTSAPLNTALNSLKTEQ